MAILGLVSAVGVLWAHLAMMLSPTRWAIPAIAGMAFPAFGVGLFISTLIMLRWRRWRWFSGFFAWMLLSVELFVSTWGGMGMGMPSFQDDVPPLTLLNWNVRLYDRYGWLGDQTMDGISEAVEREHPDVLCIQEHYRDAKPRNFPVKQRIKAAVSGVEKAPVHLHEVWARKRGGKRFGVATFSRHPIVGRDEILFGTKSNNACAVTDILWAGDTLRVFNAHFASLHFGSQEYAALDEGVPDAEGRQRIWSRIKEAYAHRVPQVSRVIEAVSQSPHPVMLCGDFNDVPVSWTLHELRRILRDAHDVRLLSMDGTWQGAVPGVRIDHVFVDPTWPVLAYGTGGEGLSDHRYVKAVVQAPSP